MENKIRKLRQKMGISRRKLGLETNIPEATLRRYEANTTEPKLDTWSRLADFFGVSVEYLQGKKSTEEQTGWIKFKTRPMTEEEKEEVKEERPWVDEDEQCGFDCPVPDIGQKVLVTDGQWVGVDEWDDFAGVIGLLDFNRYDTGYDNLWWMPMPDLPKTEEK